MSWLQGILGILGFIGKLFDWRQQKKHDELVVKAESAKRAEEALRAAREANEREADIRRLDDAALDERLRRFERKL